METPKYFIVERVKGEINDTDYVCSNEDLENWLRNVVGKISLKKDLSIYKIDSTPIPFKMTRPRIWLDGKELLPEDSRNSDDKHKKKLLTHCPQCGERLVSVLVNENWAWCDNCCCEITKEDSEKDKE